MVRILTGILLAVGVSVGIVFLSPNALKAVIAGLAAICLFEFARMALPKHPSSSPALLIVSGIALALAVMFGYGKPAVLLLALPLIVMSTFVFYLFRQHSLELVFTQISRSVFGAVYGGLMFSFLGLLRDVGIGWLFVVLGTTFAADTGAFFAGHLLGRHKLAPRVSPSKTIEGLLGGWVAAVAVAFLCKILFAGVFSVRDCFILGAVAGLIGPLGDLSESMIKRSMGVKDSGDLIPGHGGLLDRVDALLFTSPVVYYYAAYLRHPL
jgi:CDP-diglyceride synthetase